MRSTLPAAVGTRSRAGAASRTHNSREAAVPRRSQVKIIVCPADASSVGQSRYLTLRRGDRCVDCGHSLVVGDHAYWDADRKVVECLACRPEMARPGASADRITRQRTERRHEKVRQDHPHIGGFLLRLQAPPQHEKAWASGAVGERVVGGELEKLAAGASMFVLHDRRVPGSNANIDHIVVAHSGIWVIDAKRYQKKRVETRARKMRPALVVGGYAQAKLVAGVTDHAKVVRDVLDGGFSVRPLLCFVDALFNTVLHVDGVVICPPDRLRKVLLGRGPITEDCIADIGRSLARTLRAA
jgi:hypothetical protein